MWVEEKLVLEKKHDTTEEEEWDEWLGGRDNNQHVLKMKQMLLNQSHTIPFLLLWKKNMELDSCDGGTPFVSLPFPLNRHGMDRILGVYEFVSCLHLSCIFFLSVRVKCHSKRKDISGGCEKDTHLSPSTPLFLSGRPRSFYCNRIGQLPS